MRKEFTIGDRARLELPGRGLQRLQPSQLRFARQLRGRWRVGRDHYLHVALATADTDRRAARVLESRARNAWSLCRAPQGGGMDRRLLLTTGRHGSARLPAAQPRIEARKRPRQKLSGLEPHDRALLNIRQHEHEVAVLALALDFHGLAQEGQEPGLAGAGGGDADADSLLRPSARRSARRRGHRNSRRRCAASRRLARCRSRPTGTLRRGRPDPARAPR